MAKLDAAPKFTQPNPPPVSGSHSTDREGNSFLRFFDKVLGGKAEVSTTIANDNVNVSGTNVAQNDQLAELEMNVVEAAGNFLAETSRGAAVHGQSISSNAEATAALDKLFNAYEQYHSLCQEIRASSESRAQIGEGAGQISAAPGNTPTQPKGPQVPTPKPLTPFKPVSQSGTATTTPPVSNPPTPADNGGTAQDSPPTSGSDTALGKAKLG